MSFKYESDGSNSQQQVNDFQVPGDLILPLGLNVVSLAIVWQKRLDLQVDSKPSSMKDHHLMERTALFIHKNGPQMEIILKIKQSSNPAFSFLNFDSPLNQYFRYLLSVIRAGKYVPKEKPDKEETVVKETDPDSDSDDDGGYLHPSLMGGMKAPVVPRLETTSCHESLPQKRAHETPDLTNTSAAKTVSAATPSVSLATSIAKQKQSKPSKFSILPPLPLDLEKIVDKLAEKVAQAGEEFETSIKRRADPRFEFLNPGNCFHAHYVRRKLHHIEENQKRAAESKQNAQTSGRSISFSFIKTKSWTDDEIGVKEKTGSATTAPELPVETETLSREKRIQEERKKRVAAFLSLMRSREEADEKETSDDQNKHEDKQDTHSDRSSIRTSAHASSTHRDRTERDSSRYTSSRDKKHRHHHKSHTRSPSIDRSERRRSKSRRSRSRSRSRS